MQNATIIVPLTDT